MKKNSGFSFLGVLIFFLTFAFSATVIMFAYAIVDEKTNGDIKMIALVMLLVILFLSVLCSAIDILRRHLMVDKPTEKILQATEKIANGDFSVRLTPHRRYGKYDQYDEIMENINTLAEALGKSEMLNADFIANVSHELKTPLAVIQNYAAALQTKNLDEQTRMAYAATLQSASIRLATLVANILKLNKLENQKILPEKTTFRLDEQLTQSVLLFEEQIEQKNLTLSCTLEEIQIFSAEELLEIVWNNLLSNAVKFTNDGGMVGLTLKKAGKNVVVEVSDTGCGISPETGKRIFDKFYQGDTSHASQGNGLGLALVKKVIHVLGGEISVHSEIGKGSTFIVTLKDVYNEK